MLSHRPRRIRSSQDGNPFNTSAMDDLRFIRQTMERSAAFTAVPGWGMVAVGATALPAAWLEIWICEAVLAVSLAIVAIQSKAIRRGLPWTSGPGRRVALSFIPSVVAAAVLTIPLVRANLGSALPGTWMLLYGVGVITGGAFSVPVVPIMGVCFMTLGATTLFLPALGNEAMATGFGGLHMLFGIWIARRYGG